MRLVHYKKFEQTDWKLKTTDQIVLFRTDAHGGLVLKSSGDTYINMTWNNEGPPKFQDISISVQSKITVGMEEKDIYVSITIFL